MAKKYLARVKVFPPHLARVLSGRNEPSVLEKEGLFLQLQGRLPQQRNHRSLWAAIGGVLSLGAAVSMFVLLKPSAPPVDRLPAVATDEFASRGDDTSKQPSVRLICLDREREVTCRVGGTLAFEFAHLPESAQYFAAFAKHPDGTILWYAPDTTGSTPPIDRSRAVQRLAVELSSPHGPHQYEVYTIFSHEALTRSELRKALGASLESNSRVQVIRRTLDLGDRP